MLGEETMNLIDESDWVGNQTSTNAMNGLDRQLISRLRHMRIDGRPTASQMASASFLSFLFD